MDWDKLLLKNSKMLSSDVSAAYDPNYASVNERKNTAYFSKGLEGMLSGKTKMVEGGNRGTRNIFRAL